MKAIRKYKPRKRVVPQIMWAVVDSMGNFSTTSLCYYRRESIKRWEAAWTSGTGKDAWAYWYRRGYRCRRVKVVGA